MDGSEVFEIARHDDRRRLLVDAAIGIIERDGFSGLSVRSLAREAHFSSSAIGYQTNPWDQFCDDVWRAACSSMTVSHVLPYHRTREWPDRIAAAIFDWMERSPLLADFCIDHTPGVLIDRRRHALGDVLPLGRDGSPIDDAILHGFSRSLQAVIGMARLVGREQGVPMLADDIRRQVEWLHDRLGSIRDDG